MLGFLIGYSVARSQNRAAQRRRDLPPGYSEWEFFILVQTCLVGAIWPIHLGFQLTRWGLPVVWSISIATICGIIALATGVGYLLVGILYAGFWLAALIERGVREEESQ